MQRFETVGRRLSHLSRLTISHDVFAPFVAMTFLWSYFRPPSFVSIVFPGEVFSSFGLPPFFSNAVMPLSVLSLVCALLVRLKLTNASLWVYPGGVAATGLLGVFGVILGHLAMGRTATLVFLVLSAFGVSAAMICALLLCGRALSSWPVDRWIVAAFASYLANFILFLLTYQHAIASMLAALTPALTTLPWLFCKKGHEEDAVATGSSRLLVRDPVLWLLILFLLVGDAVRGIVGNGSSPGSMRSYMGIVLVALLMVVWASGKGDLLRSFVLCWGLLVLAFFVGVFLILAVSDRNFGNYLVASVRILLSVLYMIFLCGVAHKGAVQTTPFFLIYGAMAWAVFWLVGYVLIPWLVHVPGRLHPISPELITLTAALVSVMVLTSVCVGLFTALIRRGEDGGDGKNRQTEIDVSDRFMLLVQKYGLTLREAEVATLFAKGFSLKRAADECKISRSTAQTHIKNVYRKCGVHQKDELIDLVNRLSKDTI